MRATKVDKVDKGRHNSKLLNEGVKINMHTSGNLINHSKTQRQNRTEISRVRHDRARFKGGNQNDRPPRGEGYAKAHPELISAFMTTTAANFATLTEREIAEAEQVTTINVKTGEVE